MRISASEIEISQSVDENNVPMGGKRIGWTLWIICLTLQGNTYSEVDYLSLYLQNRISLQTIVAEFIGKSRYSELYELLEEIVRRTNVYEARVEKIKIGYPLGKDVLDEIYSVMNTNIFERYLYVPVFSDRKLIFKFSKHLESRKEVSEMVARNFFQLCDSNNLLEPVVSLVKAKKITNKSLLSKLIEKLHSFSLYSEIREIYYSLRDEVVFGDKELPLIARALGEEEDEECLRILSADNVSFAPIRIEFLIRFGYIQEGLEEVKNYGISPQNAKYVFIAFLTRKDFANARMCLNYVTLPSEKKFLELALGVLSGRKLTESERELKNMLLSDTPPDIKNQVGFLLWIINTSENLESMQREIIFCLSYLNRVRNKETVSQRVLEKIKPAMNW